MSTEGYHSGSITPTPIVLDTNVLIHLFIIKHPPAVQWFNSLSNQPLIMPSIVVNELMYVKNKEGGLLIRKRDIPIVTEILQICKLDLSASSDYTSALARVDALYGKSNLGFADAIIAECVLRYNALFCTYDDDFNVIQELLPLLIRPYAKPLATNL